MKGPTLVGDTLHVECEVIEHRLSSKPDRGLVRTRNEVVNQHGKAVMVYSPERLMRVRGAVATDLGTNNYMKETPMKELKLFALLAKPEVREQLVRMSGAEFAGVGHQQFAELIAFETERVRDLIKISGADLPR